MSILSKLPAPIKTQLKIFIHRFQRLKSGMKKIETDCEFLVFKAKDCDTFFGYYDVSPFDAKGHIAYLEHKKDSMFVRVVLDDEKGGNKQYLADSNAWNWQQGCRLRWMPGENKILSFNDFREGMYFNRMLNTNTNEERRIDWPLYDIDPFGKYGLSLDFERLGVKRPGYGYTCRGYEDNTDLASNGIEIIDLEQNMLIEKITYKDITDAQKIGNPNYSNNYINHLSFSPSGSKFLFFWIDVANGFHQASLLIYDLEKKVIIPLETEDKVSHYDWLDDDYILCTCLDRRYNCKYYMYKTTGEKKHICPNSLKTDGHPSFLDNNTFITDSYPDSMGYQTLYFVDMKNDTKKILAKLYSIPVLSGDRRTDLHPRVSQTKNLISVDSNGNGLRNLYIIKR